LSQSIFVTTDSVSVGSPAVWMSGDTIAGGAGLRREQRIGCGEEISWFLFCGGGRVGWAFVAFAWSFDVKGSWVRYRAQGYGERGRRLPSVLWYGRSEEAHEKRLSGHRCRSALYEAVSSSQNPGCCRGIQLYQSGMARILERLYF